ncbi:MAG TPA: carboxypeptidase-like regulatory domain-containing protein [Bryobacteraceae bacterium]|nr:carboxypeptidase-like regulatory domain-containing protein [Bryobacteraceae bacterium]
MRLLAAVLLFAGLAAAQTPTATVVGRIVDPTRAAVAGATVRVRNVDTNDTRTVQSTAEGEYTVSSLPPGTFEISFEKTGFRATVEKNLELQVDQTARVDVQLAVGAVAQSMEVVADVPLVNTETASRGDVVTPREITEMPLNGRDFNDLVFLVAGAQPAEQGGKGSPYVVNGARADASNVVIDGLNDQNPRDAGAQARPPLDSLQEFKIQTSGYSAEYGRLAGGVVNMALKSGGNQVHGSLFEYVRNDMFDARNFFDQAKSELRRNQFGAGLDGPVRIPKLYSGHDRTFFLVSWESYRQVMGSNSIGVIPTPAEMHGDFSQDRSATGQLVLIKDPLASGSCTATNASACFPGNLIPAARISSISQRVAANFPAPNLIGANNFLAHDPTPDSWDSFLFKVDERLSLADTAAIRIVERWETSTNPFSGSSLGTFGATTGQGQALLGVSETHIFTPTLVNEFRIGLTRTKDNELSAHNGTNWASQYGIPGTTNDPNLEGFPKFSITGYETIGDSTSDPIRYVVNNYNLNDAVTWNKGRHSIRIGGDVLRVQYFQPTNSNFNGTFTFNGKMSGDGFADLLLGFPSSTSRKIGTVTNHIYQTAFGSYIQDDVKATPSLTLNLGLRYEIQMPASEEYGQETNYVPSLGKVIMAGTSTDPAWQTTVAAAGLTGLVGVASDYGLPKALVNANYDNFAPRVGLAWRPFGNNRTVIRTGYGIFYTGSRLSAMRTDLTGGFPFAVAQSFTGSSSNPSQLTIANPFPSNLAKFSGVTSANGYEVNPPSPYLESWNFTIEHEIAGGVAVELGYAGSRGAHLGRKYDINQEIRTPAATTRPYAGYGDIEYYSFGWNSDYDAAIVTVRKRFTHGLFFRANYTFGKSIDENSGLNYAGDGGFQGAQNSLAPFLERGRSDFDMRHVFSMNFAWQVPVRGSRLIRGWQLAGSGTAYSGQPFTPQLSGPSIDLAQATRPDRLLSGTLPNPSPAMWFNLNAFAIVPDTAYRYGTSGRNILDGPATVAINLSLSKSFQIRERAKAQFRWETFNVTNHTDLNLPNDTLDKANAGTITGNKPPRVMQLGLRLAF